MRRILKELVKEKKVKTITIRAHEKEIEALKEKAEKYTGGNVTALLMIASREYSPGKAALTRK